ncbi:MAG: heavy metal-binding domain-containing protein [Actinomycetota bacterium]
MNGLLGYRVDEVLGEVTGHTVRAWNVGAQLGAGLKSIAGGELKGLTKELQQRRDEAKQRSIEAAEVTGANAILAMRFE